MAVDCSKWYPLPEVSPAEDHWWEKDNTKLLPDVKVSPPKSLSTPSCQSKLSVSTLTPPTSSDRHQPADLSISSLHTTTPLTMDTSSVHTPSHWSKWTSSEISSETIQSRPTGGVSHYGVKFAPQLESVSEIDELWRKFLASSLVGKENRGGVRCTCGAKKHAAKMRDTRTTDCTSKSDSPNSCPILARTRSVLVERAVQTNPMTHPGSTERQSSHHHTRIPRSASVAFTVASSQPARPQLAQLTLSEAFALSHPEFIEASLRRQREIRQQQRVYMEQKTIVARKDLSRPYPSTSSSIHTGYLLKSVGVASLGWYPSRPTMSKRDMYKASKRVWSKLPEVQAKVAAEKCKSQAETNRLRVKLYQKEVLSRLRKQNKHKH